MKNLTRIIGHRRIRKRFGLDQLASHGKEHLQAAIVPVMLDFTLNSQPEARNGNAERHSS